MSAHVRRILAILLAMLLVIAALGIVGCTGDSESEDTTETESSTTTDETDGDQDSGGSTELTAEQEEDAINIAQAYMVGLTDLDDADFEWQVEAAAVDDDGVHWARVSATPSDSSMETEQIYVAEVSPESDMWVAVDMGTGIDPSSDPQFPPEIGHQLD